MTPSLDHNHFHEFCSPGRTLGIILRDIEPSQASEYCIETKFSDEWRRDWVALKGWYYKVVVNLPVIKYVIYLDYTRYIWTSVGVFNLIKS